MTHGTLFKLQLLYVASKLAGLASGMQEEHQNRTQQALGSPRRRYATRCGAIANILRDEAVGAAQDKHYLGPFKHFPPAHAPERGDCPWLVVRSGEEAYQVLSQPMPAVRFLQFVTDDDDKPFRVAAGGLPFPPGTLTFLKGNGIKLDYTRLAQAQQDVVPFSNVYNRSVSVAWDLQSLADVRSQQRISSASLSFTFNTVVTSAPCQARRLRHLHAADIRLHLHGTHNVWERAQTALIKIGERASSTAHLAR